MTRKTNRYSESITKLLAERYHIQPEAAQAKAPHQVFALIVEAHLGGAWVREIQNWIEAVGGHIVWETTEEEADEVPFAHYTTQINYSYIEDLDD